MSKEIQKACDILNQGGVVGMPTETVYGLAADIRNEQGIKNIFAIKERPFFDPLIVHVSCAEMASDFVKEWNPVAQALANAFWPGPLTIVMPKNDKISDMITSGLDSVGLRCPNHPLALELIQTMGTGLAAPSANKFTKTSPTSATHVHDEFGDDVYVLNGGSCEVGIESTVVGIIDQQIKIYRPGHITKEDIIQAFAAIEVDMQVDYVPSPVAPGQLKHHYMPDAPVVLSHHKIIDRVNLEAKLLDKPEYWVVPSDPTVAAREMYAKFRLLSQSNPSCIIVVIDEKTKEVDEWKAIYNRLEKAASFDVRQYKTF
jgi:L-threonylcarbamoyladenylate synthase